MTSVPRDLVGQRLARSQRPPPSPSPLDPIPSRFKAYKSADRRSSPPSSPLDAPVPVPRKSILRRGSTDYYNLSDAPPTGTGNYDQLRPRTKPEAKAGSKGKGATTSPPPPDFPPPKPPRHCPGCKELWDRDHECAYYSAVPELYDRDDDAGGSSSRHGSNNLYQVIGGLSARNANYADPDDTIRPSSQFIRDLEQKIRLLDDCPSGVQSSRDHANNSSDIDSLDDFLIEREEDAGGEDEPIYSNIPNDAKHDAIRDKNGNAVRSSSPPPPVPPRKQSNDWQRRTGGGGGRSPSEYSFGDEDGYSDFGTFKRGDKLDEYLGYGSNSSAGSSAAAVTKMIPSSSFVNSAPICEAAVAVAAGSAAAAVNSITKQQLIMSSTSSSSSTSGSSASKSSCSQPFESLKSDPDEDPTIMHDSCINEASFLKSVSQTSEASTKSGFLFKSGPERKLLQKRWFTLDSSALSYYKDHPVLHQGILKPRSSPTGVMYCKNIELVHVSDCTGLLVQVPSRLQRTVSAISMKSNSSDTSSQSGQLHLWYFEIGVNCEKEKGRQYLLASESEDEGRAWIKCLTISLVPRILHGFLCAKRVDAVGSLKLRTFVSGIPTTAWLVLAERCIFLVMETDDGMGDKIKHPEIPASVRGPANVREEVITIDLRKVVSISMASCHKVSSCANVVEAGQPIAIHPLKDMVLYLQSNYRVHTDAWFKLLLREWSLPMNAGLADQYMTSDNIPVAVDKCLNFVSTYGGLFEKGIYRLNGQMSTVRTIYESLRASTQIWDLHLIPEAGIHVHDVVSAFKLFMRSFPECILTDKYLEIVMRNNQVEDREKRLRSLKSTLRQLPLINYCTLKRITSHMVSIVENSDKNEMFLSNLTPVACGVLFYSTLESLKDIAIRAQDIFTDIVSNYVHLFDVTPEELEKEKQIQKTLILLRETKFLSKPAGDILVGVYVNDRECGQCLNVRISPSMTAQDLVQYVVRTAKTTVPPSDLSVFEVVCDQQLERILHWKEVVLGVTLSWATSWPAEDAKNNFLLVKDNKSLYSHLRPILSQPPSSGGINTTSSSMIRSPAFQPFTLFSELRFSGVKWGKSFKKVIFEFVGAKLSVYKDTKATKTIGEWNIESITWFMGCEKKRNPPTDYSFTFFDRNENIDRNKDSHFFVGRVVCCNNQEEYYKWLAGMMIAEYPSGLFPPQKELIDLLS